MLSINIWKIFFYVILYSFLGYIIETIFAIITTGLWQCRQSFLYGPFCGIYGIGAVIIILGSKYFNKNNITLWIGGCIIGSSVEYLTSFLVEIILHTKWWDYSNYLLNCNGRICLLYTMFWGALALFLVKKFNPLMDRMLEKMQKRSDKPIKVVLSCTIIFFILDTIVTCYAQDIFITRMVIKNEIEIKDKNRRKEAYQKLQENKFLIKKIEKYWNDEKMIKTFPNMKIEDVEHNIIYLDSLLPEIKPYYKKLI